MYGVIGEILPLLLQCKRLSFTKKFGFRRLLNNYWMRFCDIQNNQARGKGHKNPYRDLDYSGYFKKRI